MDSGRIAQIVDADLIIDGPSRTIRLADGSTLQVDQVSPDLGFEPVTVAIRPENVSVADGHEAGNKVTASVVANSYLGARNLLVAAIGKQSIRVETAKHVVGKTVALRIPPDALMIYPRTHR